MWKLFYLNGDLDEEIYLIQPEGFSVPGHENKVCKLVKSLYGLKQALKQWHEKVDQVLLSGNFSSVEVERCVYNKIVNDDCVIICLYVDDMLICGTSMCIILEIKSLLASNFDMKDMGEAKLFLVLKS